MFYSLACAALWASTGIFIKIIDDLSIDQIIFWRFIIAAMGSFFIIKKFVLNGIDKPYAIMPLLMTVYYIAASYSFYFSPIAIAALIIGISPLFTLMIRFFLKEKINSGEVLGFIIAFIGLGLFLSESSNMQGYTLQSILAGSGMALAAAFVRAIYSYIIWHKNKVGETINLENINLHTFFIGIVIFIPFSSTQSSTYDLDLYTITGLVGLAIVATLIPNILNNKASRAISPSVHNTIGMSTPIFASIMAWIFLGEAQTLSSALYMLIVVAGIFVTTRRPRQSVKLPTRD